MPRKRSKKTSSNTRTAIHDWDGSKEVHELWTSFDINSDYLTIRIDKEILVILAGNIYNNSHLQKQATGRKYGYGPGVDKETV